MKDKTRDRIGGPRLPHETPCPCDSCRLYALIEGCIPNIERERLENLYDSLDYETTELLLTSPHGHTLLKIMLARGDL